MTHEQMVKASEEAIKNTSSSRYLIDDMNYRCKFDLFYTLAITTNNTPTFSVFGYFIANMDKHNMVEGFSHKGLYTRAKIPKRVYYKFLKDAEYTELLYIIKDYKGKGNKVMINPMLIYNFRKTS